MSELSKKQEELESVLQEISVQTAVRNSCDNRIDEFNMKIAEESLIKQTCRVKLNELMEKKHSLVLDVDVLKRQETADVISK